MKRPPTAYFLYLGAIVVVAALSALIHWGVPPFDNFQVWVLSQVMSIFTLLLLSILGGTAVGMLLAHRILSNRNFTPFERSVLEGLADIRARLDRLEADQESSLVHEKARR